MRHLVFISKLITIHCQISDLNNAFEIWPVDSTNQFESLKVKIVDCPLNKTWGYFLFGKNVKYYFFKHYHSLQNIDQDGVENISKGNDIGRRERKAPWEMETERERQRQREGKRESLGCGFYLYILHGIDSIVV